MWEPLKEEKTGFEYMKQESCFVQCWFDVFPLVEALWFYLLKSEGAAMKFPGGLKTSLFERRAADQQELMRRVHELKLLLCTKGLKRYMRVRQQNKHVCKVEKHAIYLSGQLSTTTAVKLQLLYQTLSVKSSIVPCSVAAWQCAICCWLKSCCQTYKRHTWVWIQCTCRFCDASSSWNRIEIGVKRPV